MSENEQIVKEIISDEAKLQEQERHAFIIKNRRCPITMMFEILRENAIMVRSKDENGNYIMWQYNGKHYDMVEDEDIKMMIHRFVMKHMIYDIWKSGYIVNIVSSIRSYDAIPTIKMGDNNFLCVNNGVIDLDAKKMYNHSPNFYLDTMVNVDYDYQAQDMPVFYKYLCEVLGGENTGQMNNIRKLGGYLLDNSCQANKIFLFNGPGASGKSTLINTFLMFFNDRQITSLSLEDIAGSSFKKEALLHSRINCAGEQKRTYIDAEQIKLIAEGARISISRKFKTELTIKPKFKLVLACNGLPKFNDTSSGIYRRLLIFDFPNQYKPKEEYDMIKNPEKKGIYLQDSTLAEKIEKEKSAIFNYFLGGMDDLRNDKYQFDYNGLVKDLMEKYQNENDIVREFLNETFAIDNEAHYPLSEIFKRYRQWYSLNVQEGGSIKMRIHEVARRIKEVLDVGSNGRTVAQDADGNFLKTTTYPLKLAIYEDLTPTSAEEIKEKLQTDIPF